MADWTLARVKQLIDDRIPESLILEYKSGHILNDKQERNNSIDEITKDVSAFANSAGGILIFGIAEERRSDGTRVPSRMDPVASSVTSAETLDQLLASIQPHIEGLRIHAVPVSQDPGKVIYVLEVPESITAHQATDHKYHKRFNARAVAMEDYEVRQTMARGQHPLVDLAFEIELWSYEITTAGEIFGGWLDSQRRDEPEYGHVAELIVVAQNTGRRLAQYIAARVFLPAELIDCTGESAPFPTLERNGRPYFQINVSNGQQDVAEIKDANQFSSGREVKTATYFPPLLPDFDREIERLRLDLQTLLELRDDAEVSWELVADNAPIRRGLVAIAGLKRKDERVGI
jgi:hypothetical protein